MKRKCTTGGLINKKLVYSNAGKKSVKVRLVAVYIPGKSDSRLVINESDGRIEHRL